jgi:hypothetical protein
MLLEAVTGVLTGLADAGLAETGLRDALTGTRRDVFLIIVLNLLIKIVI